MVAWCGPSTSGESLAACAPTRRMAACRSTARSASQLPPSQVVRRGRSRRASTIPRAPAPDPRRSSDDPSGSPRGRQRRRPGSGPRSMRLGVTLWKGRDKRAARGTGGVSSCLLIVVASSCIGGLMIPGPGAETLRRGSVNGPPRLAGRKRTLARSPILECRASKRQLLPSRCTVAGVGACESVPKSALAFSRRLPGLSDPRPGGAVRRAASKRSASQG